MDLEGMNGLIELLAPVGSQDALVAAVESGANAIYLAGQMFGARAYADNFDEAGLREAIRFAHMRNVLVNVTVNTMVDDQEFTELAQYLRFLYEAGADALLVQDLGVVKLAREIIPNMPLHASTQMTVHNLEGVRVLQDLGFTRVVLAREVSMEDIRYICANSEIEIEVFIHGALCVCYSGQCLMSSIIGGRSGNRGRCAQPCRLPYTLVDSEGNDVLEHADAGNYLLSPRDMNTLDLLPEFIEAGVTSLKIEGRMKRPEYVATVVDTYRRGIDSYLLSKEDFTIAENDQKNLAQIFNRDFTSAYLKGKPGRFMMSDRRPNNRGVLLGRVLSYKAATQEVIIKLNEELHINDIVDFWVKVGGRVSATITSMLVKGESVLQAAPNDEVTIVIPSPVRDHDRVFKVFDAQMMERARAFFNTGAPVRRIMADIKVSAEIGKPLVVEIKDQDGYIGVGKTDFIAEQARKRPLTEDGIRKQIERLGTTVFSLENLTCEIAGEVMVPISEINEARRRAVEMIEQARLEKFTRLPLEIVEAAPLKKQVKMSRQSRMTKPELVVSVDTLAKTKNALEHGADWILFGGESYNHEVISVKQYRQAYDMVRSYHKKISFNTPRILKQWQVKSFNKLLQAFQEFIPDEICVHNLSQILMVKAKVDTAIHADFSMNVYNNLSIEFLKELGVSGVTLSPECNFAQVETIVRRSVLPTECIVHGNLELMVSEYCAMGSFLGDLDKGKCTQPCTKAQYWFKDRKNEKFPLVTDQFCRMHLLNGKELSMYPHVHKFGQIGVNRIRIEAKYFDVKRIAVVTNLYKEFLALGEDHPLLTDDKIKTIENDQITRGHYFRGVL